MYVPKMFEEKRKDVLLQLMSTHPLAAVVVQDEKGLSANHLPLLWREKDDGTGILVGHIARSNELVEMLAESREALVIFQGPQAYISPSWYATKQEGGKVVPTWNYAVVHAHGRASLVRDPSWLREQLALLTKQQESSFSAPWAIEDAPASFVEGLLASIVGIEIEVTRLEGKWKVSQNQPRKNQDGVVEGLRTRERDERFEMASLVDERKRSSSVSSGADD
ncbi:MAG: FMN-binding negative transcriptional regulator [Myxococcales bacterium]|nr:FMN-binding negative transcriptional regulator [Myxococcales bacterium]